MQKARQVWNSGDEKKGQTAISMYKNFQNIQVKISAERASL